MKLWKTIFILAVMGFLFNSAAWAQQPISPLLQEKMLSVDDEQLIPVIIAFKYDVPKPYSLNELDAMPKNERQQWAARHIRNTAEIVFSDALELLSSAERNDQVRGVQTLEMARSISANVTSKVIQELSKLSEVKFIGLDKVIPAEEALDYSRVGETRIPNHEIFGRILSTPEWGVAKIYAPKVWDEFGVKGKDVVVAVFDSGCDYTHPDLQNQMWDGSDFEYNGQQLVYHGWDFVNNDNNPMDPSQPSHGTRSTGIVAGDGTQGRQTGVAPETGIMCFRVISQSESGWLASFDFFEDMKNEYGNDFELPDILTMSASAKFPTSPAYTSWRNVTDNLLDLGIVHINSIGNQGNSTTGGCNGSTPFGYPIPWNIATPGNSPSPWMHPDQDAPINTGVSHVSSAISVGAVNSSDVVYGTSGKGPAAWEDIQYTYPCQNSIPSSLWDYRYDTGSNPLIKPDVTAPSSDGMYSTDKGGGYTTFGGTSAATPHVAGTAALIRSVNNTLSPAEVDKTLQLTAVPLGTSGKDNLYGSGRIDAYEAVKYTLENYGGEIGQSGNVLISEEMTIQESVTVGLWSDVSVTEDINLVSGANLTIESKSSSTVTIAAASGTVTIGGPGGASKIAGGHNSGEEDSDDGNGDTENSEAGPQQFALSNNYPNPFNPTTVISYQLPTSSQVTLKVFDMLGREVAILVNGRVSAGQHEVQFDASQLSSGIYIYRLQTGEFIQTKKMMLIK